MVADSEAPPEALLRAVSCWGLMDMELVHRALGHPAADASVLELLARFATSSTYLAVAVAAHPLASVDLVARMIRRSSSPTGLVESLLDADPHPPAGLVRQAALASGYANVGAAVCSRPDCPPDVMLGWLEYASFPQVVYAVALNPVSPPDVLWEVARRIWRSPMFAYAPDALGELGKHLVSHPAVGGRIWVAGLLARSGLGDEVFSLVEGWCLSDDEWRLAAELASDWSGSPSELLAAVTA